ncbi:hypothetical protein BaRGS_00014141 [Batillaria attramentaria]|uniref:Uncharacterized protein n=1 Tax=Batillaria attramentaria TaxID=370345 RepID=A0ABD0L614_9CAEN
MATRQTTKEQNSRQSRGEAAANWTEDMGAEEDRAARAAINCLKRDKSQAPSVGPAERVFFSRVLPPRLPSTQIDLPEDFKEIETVVSGGCRRDEVLQLSMVGD